MDYGQIYANLIEKGLTRNLGDGVDFEKHHVWPKCMGGPDEASNLVKLTPEEHFLAHQLLIKMFPDNNKLVYAARMMCIDANGKRVNNKMYGWLKRRHSKAMSLSRKGKTSFNKGKNMSDDQKSKISNAHKGKKHSDETKIKMSESKKGKNTWSKGKKWSAESIAKREATRKRNKELKNLTSQ